MSISSVSKSTFGLLSFTALSLLAANPSLAITINNAGGSIPANSFRDFSYNVNLSPNVTSDVNITISTLTLSAGLSSYELYLRDPSGTALVLTLADTLSGGSFNGVTLDDSAATFLPPVGNLGGGTTYTGTFKPQGGPGGVGENSNIFDLAGFNGAAPNGTWNLRIYNFSNGVGTLGQTTLEVVAVPFEFSPTFALSALGLWGIYKARKKSAVSK